MAIERIDGPRQRPGRIRDAIKLSILLSASKYSAAFTVPLLSQRKMILTQRYYRQDDEIPFMAEGDVAAVAAAGLLSGKTSNTAFFPDSTYLNASENMPTWLRNLNGHLAVEKLYQLHDAMTRSHLTEHDADVVISAIREAAGDDEKRLAGAAEFCLILAETMEMGVSTLVAAAFHYCTCLLARESASICSSDSCSSSTYFWDEQYDYNFSYGIENFNEEAVNIAHSAAKLKRSEMAAASVASCTGKCNRVTLDTENAEKIRSFLLSESGDWRALAIRSAASLYRLRGLERARGINAPSTHPTPEEVLIAREALRIYAPLASRLGMHRLKNEIEESAFKLLYRRQYEAVTSLTNQDSILNKVLTSDEYSVTIADGMKSVLSKLIDDVKQFLQNDATFMSYASNVIVSSRIKEPYSIWKKMLKLKTRNVLDVPDALALRVIIDATKKCAEENEEVTSSRERCMCYYAQKVLEEKFSVNGEISRAKDYIMRPKANGYQSLHFTSSTQWHGQEWPFEVQIRSGDMHRTAEYGLAAHWDYKLNSKDGVNAFEPQWNYSDGYLSALQEWHWSQLGQSTFAPPNSIQELKSRAKVEEISSSSQPKAVNKHYLEKNQIRAERAKAQAERLEPYIEALSTAQSDLAKKHVFVILSSSDNSDGKVLSLPAGACVLDALREGEKTYGVDFGSRKGDFHIVHNGNQSSVTEKLSNGDILMVPRFDTEIHRSLSV